MVNDNSGWPESFGFSIAGDAPVVVVSVLENSIAHSYGLNVGDQILEINDKNVRGLSKEQVILVARRSKQCPPSVAVISRIRTFRMKRKRHAGFGINLRGSRPVYVQSVAKSSPAYEAGICPGDMLIKVNGRSVKNLDKKEVGRMLEIAGNNVKLMVIAGSYAIKKFEDRFSASSSARHKKSREFFVKMNYYLTGEEHKKTLLLALLKRYARDRDIERFSRLVSSLLTSDVQRRLLKHVRYFIPVKHQPYFDAIVNQNYSGGESFAESPRISAGNSPRDQDEEENRNKKQIRTSPRSASVEKSLLQATSTPYNKKDSTPLGSWSKSSGKQIQKAPPYRSVSLKRETGNSSFGFTISGCRPVFIRSVDEDGPAVIAGLKPGDCIIEINGINIRHASHESVIELLKNSGTFPTLIVQWRPLPSSLDVSPIRQRGQSDGSERRQQLQEINSLTDSALEIDLSPRSGSRSNQEPYEADLVQHLKDQMKKLLTRGEQLVVKQSLAYFHKDRDVGKLVEALEPVLDDPLKLQMLHCISRLLPGQAQLEFEKQAVDMVARQMENGIIISAATNDHEIFDILFRVQGSKLSETDRPRNLIGGLVDVKTDSSWPSSKTVSQSNSSGSLGSDLDQTPTRGSHTKNDIVELKESPIKDSTFEALMSIDENKILQDQGQYKSSTVVTTAVVHNSQRKSSILKKNGESKRQSDTNNNDDVFIEQENLVYSTNIDEVTGTGGYANGILTHPNQEDIEELKSELMLAQQEARKARKEADERRLVLESKGMTLGDAMGGSLMGKGPASIEDAIRERSFEMEPEKVRSASTDDHVVLPRQFPPPGMMPPPPPPPPPAPPPPPPPPGGAGMKAMQLKRINWEKVSGVSLENTVWGKLQSEDQVDDIIDFMELEQLFSTKNKPVKEKRPEKKQTSILESKKTYNLSILLGHLKMPIDELYKAVLSIDETKLTEPHIRTLLMCAPEGNEVEAYRNFSDDSKTLSTADAFTSKMMSISNYTERLRAMLFKARFYDRVSEIQPDIESVNLAAEEVKSSNKLMKILEIVLATGNYMNKGSSTMSGASGFKISFLTKLINTKTSDNKSTLLHVIVNTIKNNKSELLDVKDELTHVPLAAKVSSQMLSLEISELRTGMKEINDELKNYAIKEGNDDDRYKEVIGKFVKDAQKQFDDLLESYNKMKTSFSSTTEFYSEKQITTEDFFGAFAVFLQHLENVKKDVMSEEEKREYQARKEKELEEMRKRRNSTTSRSRSVSNASQPSIGEDELMKGFDDVLRKRSLSQGSRDVQSDGAAQTSAGFSDKERQEDDKVSPKIGNKGVEKVKVAQGLSLSVNSDAADEGFSDKGHDDDHGRLKTKSSELAHIKTSLKKSPDAVRVLPQSEPNAFAMLLKRREKIEDTDSERERADSSASDMSVFSTLPRAKFRPPPPAVPKKKRQAPPPLKPKPRQGSVDFKSTTLPRSLSKVSSDDRYDSEASRGSSGGSTSKNLPENGNISERTSSLSSTGSVKNDYFKGKGKSANEANEVKDSVKKEPSVLGIRQNGEINRFGSGKGSFHQQNDSVKPEKITEKEANKAFGSNSTSKSNETIEENTKTKYSPRSEPLVVNLGPNLPTYNIDVMYDESEIEKSKKNSTKKPAKPARKNIDFSNIITYEPAERIQISGRNHDPDDYDNLPPEDINPGLVHEDLDEPDYALPTFAIDTRSEKAELFVDKSSTTGSGLESKQSEIIDERFTAVNASMDLTDEDDYSELNFDYTETQKTPENSSESRDDSKDISRSTRSENDSDDESMSGKYSLDNKSNAFNRGNLLRDSSLSSSQSSESDSPKSYRKFKQNRPSTTKNKSSPFQKIKGVIGGMRSRSSSEASTTSVDPAFDMNKRSISALKMSPKPILKKYNKSRDNSPETITRSHSPHTVKFQDLPQETTEVVKLSTDDESLPELSFKIPPMPKSAPPVPPPDSVPPPMPPPYHLRKDSTSAKSAGDEDENTKRVISTLNVEIKSPLPPSFKPPPPPKSQKPTTPDQSPLSPTLPQFKPPPPPFLSKMKTTPKGLGKRTPPPPPNEPPPSDDVLSATSSDAVVKQNGALPPSNSSSKKLPPPPPKRIESIKPPSPSPERRFSPPSSASLLRKTLSSPINKSEIESNQINLANHSPVVTCDIDAEFDTTDSKVSSNVINNRLDNPTPPPDTPTTPLGDIPIVPPPPSPSPPKPPYLSEVSGQQVQRNDNLEQTDKNKQDVLPKSTYMVKVLPKTPPLLFRENEDENGGIHKDSKAQSSPNAEQSSTDGWHTRANRTDSISSVGSMSFPPLPPSSLLDTVEEDYNHYHTVFQF